MIRGNVHSHEKGLKGELRDSKRNLSSSSAATAVPVFTKTF